MLLLLSRRRPCWLLHACVRAKATHRLRRRRRCAATTERTSVECGTKVDWLQQSEHEHTPHSNCLCSLPLLFPTPQPAPPHPPPSALASACAPGLCRPIKMPHDTSGLIQFIHLAWRRFGLAQCHAWQTLCGPAHVCVCVRVSVSACVCV